MTHEHEASSAGIMADLLGFRPEPTRREDVESALRERIARRGLSGVAAYAQLLADPVQRAVEARCLADRLTVNETYFFREAEHFEVLRAQLMAHAERARTSPLRVLSIGCSSGEEPFSIALSLHDAGFTAQQVHVHACDASPAAIARAERGLYSDWSLRHVGESVRARHFTRTREGYALAPALRDWVRFEVRNLLDPDASFWAGPSFDAVFCRNLLIYLTPQAIRSALERFAQVLAPGGTLFLGHSETAHAGPQFASVQARDSFYFVRRSQRPQPSASVPAAWNGTIEASTRRLRELEVAHTPRPSPAPARSEPARDLMQLLRSERWADALAVLELQPKSAEHALLRAALLANQARLQEAHAACHEMLAVDPSSAPAHHLLGLLQEQAGNIQAACSHHERAAALDPDFAMPRLRAGALKRRNGEHAEARRLLREALRLLPHQPARSVLLYGGGFSVDALIALCRAELAACGGVQ